MKTANKTEIAVFGGGCFWCTEAMFKELRGVISITPGYAGGTMERPTYQDVSTGQTGHAEVIKIEYNPALISYNNLLTVFFMTHDPATLNRQGADIGTQYRSVVFYTNDRQKKEAEQFIAKLNTQGQKVMTTLEPLGAFYEAEEYHKDYYAKNSSAPYCQIVINPKLEKLKTKFHMLLKSSKEITS